MDRLDREEHGASLALALLGGMAAGALAMYLTDPQQGSRRRARAQDAMRGMTGRAGGAVSSAWRDASSRLSGWQESASRLMGQRSAKPIDNHVLEARVRAKLNRAASNADAIEVHADAGRVTLSGPVVPQERDFVLDLVQSIPGVEAVRARLDEGEQEFPTVPVLSVLALAGGAILGYYGLRHRSSVNAWLRSGMDWISSGVHGLDLGLFGGLMRGAPVSVERSIDINAAPEAVFQIWSRYENFPHFMSHVIEVRDLGGDRSHWIVRGPAGADIEWTSMLTRSERPNFLAWESEPGAMVENSGAVWLEPIPGGGTRATVRMNYRPPVGSLGRAAASLMGSDPAGALEDDLLRMRDFIERGKTPPAEAEVGGGKRHILH